MAYIFAPVIINNSKIDDMKTKHILSGLILVVVTVVATNLYASSLEAFNDTYKISSEEIAVPGKDVAKCWNIVYGESNVPVKVYLNRTKSGDEYTVRTSYFEVKYVNGARGFGVCELKGIEQQVPADLNYKVLNSVSLNNQKIISGSKVADHQVLDLIAGFLPELINEQFKSILN